MTERDVRLVADGVEIDGTLGVPGDPRGIVCFAHGSGSSRFSGRNRYVADALREAGLATLLIDLLTAEEEQVDLRSRELRFDIGLLARRVVGACDWLRQETTTATLPIGTFGASTGAAAALIAAAERPDAVRAVVSRGGRPDLAGPALERVRAPVLLIVGGLDHPVIEMNREAATHLQAAPHELVIVSGATHLFEEPGTLEQVAALARDFFLEKLGG